MIHLYIITATFHARFRYLLVNRPLGKSLTLEKEKALVEKAKKDVNAFAKLYDLYVDDIYRYVLYRVGTAEDAEDITAVVFEKALKSIGSFEWRGFKFSSWLYRIAHNLVVDSYKKAKDTLSIEEMGIEFEDTSSSDLLLEVSKGFDVKNLMEAVGNLTEDQREVVYLRYVKELSIQETIDVTGKTIDSVKSLSKRGIIKLKEILKED